MFISFKVYIIFFSNFHLCWFLFFFFSFSLFSNGFNKNTDLKITRFGDAIEARAIHCSSSQCLLQPNDFVAPHGTLSLNTSNVCVTHNQSLEI